MRKNAYKLGREMVEPVGQAVGVITADVRPEQRLRHRPGRIGCMSGFHQPLENALRQLRLRRVVDFVAHAVEDDAGVIAITPDGVAFVRF